MFHLASEWVLFYLFCYLKNCKTELSEVLSFKNRKHDNLLYDAAAVSLCVVPVIAFLFLFFSKKSEMSPFKMDTVNIRKKYIRLLDVDISMINLH